MTEREEFAELVAAIVLERLAAQQQLVGRAELAHAAGISVRSIDRWAKEGRLPVQRAGRRVLFPLADSLKAIRSLNN